MNELHKLLVSVLISPGVNASIGMGFVILGVCIAFDALIARIERLSLEVKESASEENKN